MSEGSILHVEDDEAAALLVQLALKETWPEIQSHRVNDVDTALNFLVNPDPHVPPNLIILDLNLPRKSGFELLKLVRGSLSLSHVPVVVLTSSAALADYKKAMGLGAAAYIVKPSTYEGFLAALRDIIKFIEDPKP